MDTQTINTYQNNAAQFCATYQTMASEEMYHLMQTTFHAGQPTADIGCGSGRDAAWLAKNGFPIIAYDGTEAMLAEATQTYPYLDLRHDTLPALATIPDNSYANVLCCAVLMHLPQQQVPQALHTLARILLPLGRLIFTYRPSRASSEREPDGRLYTTLSQATLEPLLQQSGLNILRTMQQQDVIRSDVLWQVVVAEKAEARG